MPATQTLPDADADVDVGSSGRYVTDGVHLYRLLEPLDEGAHGMVGVEDCGSLEIVLVPSRELLRSTRPVTVAVA